jgi:hypothetical protein
MPSEEYITCTESTGTETFRKSLIENDQYCKCCFEVSRDLCVFAQELPAGIREHQKINTAWTVDLVELAQSAEAGCQFCGFVAVNCFFTSAVYAFGALELENSISCCAVGCSLVKLGEEKSSPVIEAVVQLREFCKEYPGARVEFRIAPVDYIMAERKYGRLRMSPVRKWNFDDEGVKELIRYKASTVLEIYSTNGRFRRVLMTEVTGMILILSY